MSAHGHASRAFRCSRLQSVYVRGGSGGAAVRLDWQWRAAAAPPDSYRLGRSSDSVPCTRAASNKARQTGSSALCRQRLAQSQVVAAGVANGSVADAVGLVNGLLKNLRPGGAQRLEGLVQVVDLNEDRQIAFGDNLAHLLPHRDVIMDLEAEPLGVEGQRLIQVSAEHGRVRDGKCHASDPTCGRP